MAAALLTTAVSWLRAAYTFIPGLIAVLLVTNLGCLKTAASAQLSC